jgi:hypothetical protein
LAGIPWRLLVLLRRDVAAFVGAAIALKDFESLSADDKARMHDPYFVCFQACVHDTAAQLAEEGEGALVELVFDSHPEFRGIVSDLYERYTKLLSRSAQFGSLKFASSVSTPQLQAADLVAYELRRFWGECSEAGTVAEPKRYLMRQLLGIRLGVRFFTSLGQRP